MLPAAFGLAGVHLHTYTGWGSVTYWNAYVANTQMNGLGTFYDPRLKAKQFPAGSRAGFDDLRHQQDLVTSKLAALHFYQLAIPAPAAPKKSFDQTVAARGQVLFGQKAKCAALSSSAKLKSSLVSFVVELPDPKRFMEGSDKRHRYVRLRTAADLKKPGLRPLFRAAVAIWRARRVDS